MNHSPIQTKSYRLPVIHIRVNLFILKCHLGFLKKKKKNSLVNRIKYVFVYVWLIITTKIIFLVCYRKVFEGQRYFLFLLLIQYDFSCKKGLK